MAKDKTQLLRLIFIDRKIREGMQSGVLANCRSMAAEYEVSTKSILRDIDYLKNQQNVPVEYDPGRRGYYYAEENYVMPAIHINESDLFAICIAEKALRQHEDTPIYGKLVSVFKKIEQSLPDRIMMEPSWISQRLSIIQERRTSIDPHIWETVSLGLRENRFVEISYRKPGYQASGARQVAPYHVVSFQGEWYMVGLCRRRQEVLTFAISRIKAAKLLHERFSLPADFDATQFSERRFGIFKGEESATVRIRFTRQVAPYVREREWHPDQEIIEHQDGSLVLAFPADHFFEVRQWILAWGCGAQVLEPDFLVTSIREELASMIRTYSGAAEEAESAEG